MLYSCMYIDEEKGVKKKTKSVFQRCGDFHPRGTDDSYSLQTNFCFLLLVLISGTGISMFFIVPTSLKS